MFLRHRNFICGVAALLCLFNVSCLWGQDTTASVTKIFRTVRQSRADNAFWSICVRDSTGKILTDYHANKLIHPASNLKLLTSAAALHELGPDFTYTTKIYGVGFQSDSTWKGDLIIRGTGDPSISGTFYDGDRFHVFNQFFSTLDSMGISRISGNIIGNDAYFDHQPYPKGWSWNDLSFYYGVQTGALSFNNNAVDLSVYARGKVGEKPHIEWFPFDTDYVNFINDQVITPPQSQYDEHYRRILGTNTIMLGSKLPMHYVEKESLSITDPTLFFLDSFKKYLEDGGITLSGNIIEDHTPRAWQNKHYKALAKHQSVPLRKILQYMNQESDNFYAEMILKTMAAEHFQTVGTTDLGLTLVRDFAHSMNIDTTDVHLTDASGMSPSTLISTKALSELLVQMQHSSNFNIYKQSLALAGENGTLKYRFKHTPIAGDLRGKTGYISGVRALSGYMRTSSGKKVIFSMAANNYTDQTSYIDDVQEKMVLQIYSSY